MGAMEASGGWSTTTVALVVAAAGFAAVWLVAGRLAVRRGEMGRALWSAELAVMSGTALMVVALLVRTASSLVSGTLIVWGAVLVLVGSLRLWPVVRAVFHHSGGASAEPDPARRRRNAASGDR